MNEQLLRDLYQKRRYDEKAADDAVAFVKKMESFLEASDLSFESIGASAVNEYLQKLIGDGNNSLPIILALARYFYLINNHEAYIYFTKVFGSRGVIDNIRKRLKALADEDTITSIFNGLSEPPFGSSPSMIPEFTAEFMKRLKKHLSPDDYRKALAGNNHGVPKNEDEKKIYEESGSLDEYLKSRHERNVAELQEYCDEKKIWFEQEITQEVVDYVKSNQEILSAVRDGDKLYVTKIPFDGTNYLATDDPVLRSYYACHCPFARERILDENKENVDAEWCYCSAGYAKFPYEVILGQELEVDLLQSALKGDPICRFAIRLPDGII